MAALSVRLVCTMCLALTLTSMPLDEVEAARGGGGGKTEVLPMTKAAPAAVVIDAIGPEAELRRQLRAKNGVTELSHATSVPFSQAPTGSFGFIAPRLLGMALVTQSPDLVLERVAPAPNAYEVHKLADGSGMLVGFIGRDLVSPLMPAQRPNNIRIALFSNPLDKAAHIAAVPLTKLMVDRMPVQVDAKNKDGAVVLDMDLQSSANRKSPVMGQ